VGAPLSPRNLQHGSFAKMPRSEAPADSGHQNANDNVSRCEAAPYADAAAAMLLVLAMRRPRCAAQRCAGVAGGTVDQRGVFHGRGRGQSRLLRRRRRARPPQRHQWAGQETEAGRGRPWAAVASVHESSGTAAAARHEAGHAFVFIRISTASTNIARRAQTTWMFCPGHGHAGAFRTACTRTFCGCRWRGAGGHSASLRPTRRQGDRRVSICIIACLARSRVLLTPLVKADHEH